MKRVLRVSAVAAVASVAAVLSPPTAGARLFDFGPNNDGWQIDVKNETSDMTLYYVLDSSSSLTRNVTSSGALKVKPNATSHVVGAPSRLSKAGNFAGAPGTLSAVFDGPANMDVKYTVHKGETQKQKRGPEVGKVHFYVRADIFGGMSGTTCEATGEIRCEFEELLANEPLTVTITSGGPAPAPGGPAPAPEGPEPAPDGPEPAD
jgi:hypothetical protein